MKTHTTNDPRNLPLDLTGTPINHPFLENALRDLCLSRELLGAMDRGYDCVACYAPPRPNVGRLTLRWAPTSETLPEGWVPFYHFCRDLDTTSHMTRIRYALKQQPILLDGEYTPVDYQETCA